MPLLPPVYGKVIFMPDEYDTHPAGILQPGTDVEFDDFENPEIKVQGRVMNYLPPQPETGFKGGYHIALYYVVPTEDVRVIEPGSTEHMIFKDRTPNESNPE